MILKRALILAAVVIGVVLWAYLHPIQKPKIPTESRYIKLTKDGSVINVWQGPWRCVKDSKTELLWEIKSVNEDIYDEQSTFSWFDGLRGVADRGSCFVGAQYCDTADIIQSANAENLCGVSSWRLPTIEELQSLLKEDARPGEPLIDTSFFPYTRRAPYWSNESQKRLFGIYKEEREGALSISFKDAMVKALPYNSTCFVRLVSDAGFEK